MKDSYGRVIDYLRISVTDLCNLRCLYCMPEKGVEKREHKDILSVEEIEEIVSAAVDLGVTKVRVTGGEPLVRRGILEICRRIGAIPGVEKLCMTTNGVLLKKHAAQLFDAGVTRLNISLDTLDREKYSQLTRMGTLEDVLGGIDEVFRVGFSEIKINTVLMGGVNDDEIRDIAALTKDRNIHVRFIELMPIGECAQWGPERFISNERVLEELPALEEAGVAGVARIYRLPEHRGTVGLISPISSHFCPSCNRIRVTADGRLKPCLHSAEEINLRGLQGEELRHVMSEAIFGKPHRHHLDEAASSSLRHMNEIGG
jgi:cyclic pyranopterin phosphate synthase